MDLFKRIMEGKNSTQGGDEKQFVIDLLGADPIEMLKKKVDEVNRLTSGTPLEMAAAIYAMEKAIKGVQKANIKEVMCLLDAFEKCCGVGVLCVGINKETGETSVKNLNLDKE